MNNSDDLKRKRFENWLERNFTPVPNMLRREGDRYFLPSTEAMWELWNQEMKNEPKVSARLVILMSLVFIATYFILRWL